MTIVIKTTRGKTTSKPGSVGRLINSRVACGTLVGFGVVQLALAAAGVELWRCPWHSVTGGGCPGCGLSRSAVASLRGDWAGVWEHHLFGPLAVAALILLLVAAGLPAKRRAMLSQAVDAWDRRTRLSLMLTVALLMYWAGRSFL